jgi:hypothetical protein
MANSSLTLVNLDFDTNKSDLKDFLRSQDLFLDYDFDGANINVLLDVLAYNTYKNGFLLNMVGNEGFLDTAQLRDSVVSHAKELNYTPRSFRSAEALVDITITSTDDNKVSVTIPKGTSFTGRIGPESYSFTTDKNIVVSKTDGVFYSSNVSIFEGNYVTESFSVNYEDPVNYTLKNKNIDTRSITVTVLEDAGATVLTYLQSTSLFDLDDSSKVFFIQGASNERYEIVFGDGIIGRKPKNNSVIVVEYRLSSGELPNGTRTFRNDGNIDSESNVSIYTVSSASGGAVAESLESIRYNAPRHFTTQERAVTTEDYENLLRENFPEINVVSAYGGEEADPPQYGKVLVAVDLQNLDGLPSSKEIVYKKFLKARSPLAIDPIFVEPERLYVNVKSTVDYNLNLTTASSEDIKTFVISAIVDYNEEHLDDFKSTLRASKLGTKIDDSQVSIISNDTKLLAIKEIEPTVGVASNYDVKFNISLFDTLPSVSKSHNVDEEVVINSSLFIINNQHCILEDDGDGIMRIVTISGDKYTTLKQIGTVNYSSGLVQLQNFKVDQVPGGVIKIYAKPKSKDISSNKNTILSIREEDIDITINAVRE